MLLQRVVGRANPATHYANRSSKGDFCYLGKISCACDENVIVKVIFRIVKRHPALGIGLTVADEHEIAWHDLEESPSDAALRAHDAVWRATEAGIQAAHAGAKVSDLWSAMTKVLMAAGMKGNNVGRCGHGLGLQLTEPPSNSQDDSAVLMPGMIMTIEPGMEYEDGKLIVHEENILITEEGLPEPLTIRAPREMWRID